MFRFLCVYIFNQKQASFFTWCSDLCLINTLKVRGGEKKKKREKKRRGRGEGGGGGGVEGGGGLIRLYVFMKMETILSNFMNN